MFGVMLEDTPLGWDYAPFVISIFGAIGTAAGIFAVKPSPLVVEGGEGTTETIDKNYCYEKAITNEEDEDDIVDVILAPSSSALLVKNERTGADGAEMSDKPPKPLLHDHNVDNYPKNDPNAPSQKLYYPPRGSAVEECSG